MQRDTSNATFDVNTDARYQGVESNSVGDEASGLLGNFRVATQRRPGDARLSVTIALDRFAGWVRRNVRRKITPQESIARINMATEQIGAYQNMLAKQAQTTQTNASLLMKEAKMAKGGKRELLRMRAANELKRGKVCMKMLADSGNRELSLFVLRGTMEEAQMNKDTVKAFKYSLRALSSIASDLGDAGAVERVIDELDDMGDMSREVGDILNRSGDDLGMDDIDAELDALAEEDEDAGANGNNGVVLVEPDDSASGVSMPAVPRPSQAGSRPGLCTEEVEMAMLQEEMGAFEPEDDPQQQQQEA